MVSNDDAGQFVLDEEFFEEELKRKLVSTNVELEPIKNNMQFRFALSRRQRQELIDVAGSYNDTHELMIILQLMTGIRIGEVVNLELSDLFIEDIANAEIWIQMKITDDGKGNEMLAWKPKTTSGSRRVSIPEDVVKKLKRYIGKHRKKKGYLFVSNKGDKYREDTAIHFINKYAKECKTIHHNIGSNVMRRTYASILIDDEVPIGIISKKLGHASMEITMKYLFDIESSVRDDVK